MSEASSDGDEMGTPQGPPERKPYRDAPPWPDTKDVDGLERRVCPNCRNYFDVGVDSDAVFCSTACRKRHERGEFL